MSEKLMLNRRDFLKISGLGLGAVVLAACSPRLTTTTAPETAALVPTPVPTDINEPIKIIGDVLDFGLDGDWPGRFGFVKMRLNAGYFNGGNAYYVRTDTSDAEFAVNNKLVFVPKLNVALKEKSDAAANIYIFQDGSSEQLPILSTVPSEDNYSSLFRVHYVGAKDGTVYTSEAELQNAESAGDVTISQEDVFVNYPVVKWHGGEMSVNQDRDSYLGTGQLLEPVDTNEMTVTFKLHECYPNSRYIVTDTSAVPMAPMMSVSPAGRTQTLIGEDYDGTDKIWVFANGIEGSGVMGFQPAVFAHSAGNPVWSPFWNHFTLKWNEDATPRILKSEADINAALETGEVELFNGTPDTHPTGFVVNCPVPILAPNTFAG